MTDAARDSPDPLRSKIALREQADAAARELTMRYRVYSKRVAAGQMTEAEKAHGISQMRAIRDTLRLLAEFEDDVRATLERCLDSHRAAAGAAPAEPGADPTAGIERHPAVAAVLDAFPGARLSVTSPGARSLTPAQGEP